jgi:hypothetical protein
MQLQQVTQSSRPKICVVQPEFTPDVVNPGAGENERPSGPVAAALVTWLLDRARRSTASEGRLGIAARATAAARARALPPPAGLRLPGLEARLRHVLDAAQEVQHALEQARRPPPAVEGAFQEPEGGGGLGGDVLGEKVPRCRRPARTPRPLAARSGPDRVRLRSAA